MEGLFRAMAVLIEYPVLAAAVGIVLLALGRHAGRRVVVGAGVAWLLYAIYEFGMSQRWVCSGECNIRIDLLVLYPVLLIGLAAAGVSLIRAQAGPRPPR